MADVSVALGRWNLWVCSRSRDFWKRPLVRAFGLSITFHLCLFGTLELGHRAGLWQQSLLPDWLKPEARKLTELAKEKEKLNPKQQSLEDVVPTVFVQVDPSVATDEAPKNANYYGAQNSQAANPNPVMMTEVPKIDGQQTKVIKTTSASKPAPAPLPVRPPEPEPVKQTKAEELKPRVEAKPETAPPPGELTEAKPAASVAPKAEEFKPVTPAVQPRPRPRRLAEVLTQHGQLAGEKMRQEGGVQRRATVSSLDVKGTPYGAYDEAIVAAIQKRWFDLLDQNDYVRGRTGKVVLEFKMLYNGRIDEMNEVENTVGEFLGLICERAVQDPAPYPVWPPELRRVVGGNSRLVRFTFYYD